MDGERAGARQLDCCLYVCLAVDLLARPLAAPQNLPAQALIPAAALDLLALWAVLKLPGGGEFWRPGRAQTALRWAAAAVLTAGAGLAACECGAFLDIVGGGRQLPFWQFAVLLAGLSWYAARLGPQAVTRAAPVLAALLVLSLALLWLANAPQMRLQNLSFDPQQGRDIAAAARRGLFFPPALLAGAVLRRQTVGPRPPAARLAAALFFTYAAAALLGELVLGAGAAVLAQPVYTAAQVGGLSVFRSLDSLHAFFWLLALLQKTALLAAAQSRLLRRLLPGVPDAAVPAAAAGMGLAAALPLQALLPTVPQLCPALSALSLLTVLAAAALARAQGAQGRCR